MVRTRAAGTWRACRNSSHSSAVRVGMISSSTAISRSWSASRSSLVFFAISGRSRTFHSRACWRMLLAPSITRLPSLVGERAVRRVRMAVAVRLRMRAVAEIAGDMRGHQDHRHVEHRHVDALAFAGALALVERGRKCERAGHAGGVVDRRRAELDRMNVLRPGHRHDAGGGLDDVVIGGLVATRAVLAERRERGVDQPRIDRRKRVVAKPQRLERAGPVVLDEHVGGLDELFQNFAVALLLEVERHRALVRGLREERRAHLGVVERLVGAASRGSGRDRWDPRS